MTVTPRYAAFRAEHPDAPLYVFMVWVSQQWRAFHATHSSNGNRHDCHTCRAANDSGEFDRFVQGVTP